MKSSRVIRALLFLPIWIRRRFIHANAKAVLRNYDRTVRGGYLIISPSNFPGKFKVDATSDLARRVVQEGVFEPELTALLNDFAGCRGDIVNVGANIGFYAVFFAQNFPNIRRVLAVEPNPEAFEMLQQNIEANGVGHRVEVLQACIGEAPGRVELAIVPGKTEYSSIGGIVHASVAGLDQQRVTVDVLQLTKLASDRALEPEIILADTEGAELQVLKGAEAMIKNLHPLLIFECEDDLLRKFDHSSKMLESYVESLGYQVRNALSPKNGIRHPFSGVAIAVPTNRNDWLSILQRSKGKKT